jgi:hypothetical protein
MPARWLVTLLVASPAIGCDDVSHAVDAPPAPVDARVSGPIECRVSNRATWAVGGVDCRYGTLIERVDEPFRCSGPLQFQGDLPLYVRARSTTAWTDTAAVLLDTNCRGDDDPDTIDLILEIEGTGPKSDVGNGQDALKTRMFPGPEDIQLTGTINCGRRVRGARQDGIQIQGGSNLAFVNIKMGDYANGTSTCEGEGGAFFFSSNNPTNIDVLGGEYVACSHGLSGGAGTMHDVVDAKFRAGRNDGSDPNCTFASGGACTQTTDLTLQNVTCEDWNPSSSSWQ